MWIFLSIFSSIFLSSWFLEFVILLRKHDSVFRMWSFLNDNLVKSCRRSDALIISNHNSCFDYTDFSERLIHIIVWQSEIVWWSEVVWQFRVIWWLRLIIMISMIWLLMLMIVMIIVALTEKLTAEVSVIIKRTRLYKNSRSDCD